MLPLEQPRAERVLDPAQRARQARLRDPELVRRRRQVLGAGEGDEPAQVLGLHPRHHTIRASICVAAVISRMPPRLSPWERAVHPVLRLRRRGTAAAAPGADGYRLGDPEYRRISVALFGAGLATFALLYSTQPLLPELARAFSVSAGQSALSVSLSTVGLGARAAGRRARVGGGRAHPADPPVAVQLGGRGAAVRGGAGLDRAARAAHAARASRSRACRPWRWPTCARRCTRTAHAKATGLYIGGTALGGMAGRLVAGGLADLGGWRLALGGIGALALACAVLARWLLPASRHFVAGAGPAARPARRRPAGWSATRRCWRSTASARR